MCLAMCGTLAKVRQNDEKLVVEFAESGLLRHYSNCSRLLDISRETGGRLDQSQITLGATHKSMETVDDLADKEAKAAAAAAAAAAARAEAEAAAACR